MARPKAAQPPAVFNFAATLAVLAAAAGLTWLAWDYYEYTPWTRDGRVRVYTVQVAPEVSGTIVELGVKDNQFVHKGDMLFRIDPRTYQNAVRQAVGKLAQAKAQASYLDADARRRAELPNLAVSREDQQNSAGIALAATDAVVDATGSLDQAELNLERSTVRATVNGWVTNLLLQDGGFATTGQTAMTVINADSFWIEGYFEETQLRRIHVGDPVQAVLLAYPGIAVTGRVSGLGRGIDVSDAAPGVQGLPSVNPVFTWVRLAQRIPVRVDLEDTPCPIVLSSGLTATVTVLGPRARARAPAVPDGRKGAEASLACRDG